MKTTLEIVRDFIILGLWEQAKICSSEYRNQVDIERENIGDIYITWMYFGGRLSGYTILCQNIWIVGYDMVEYDNDYAVICLFEIRSAEFTNAIWIRKSDDAIKFEV